MRTSIPKQFISFNSEKEALRSKSKKNILRHSLVFPKRITLFLTFLLLLINLAAQIPAGYYNAATGTGDVLRANLRDIITAGHVKLPYTSTAFDVWDAYSHTDVRPSPNNTIVWDMYSDIPSGSPVYTFTIYTDQCGSASQEGDCYSREHLLPNSWWGTFDNASNPQYSDLHHLFPADQYVNNKKSNNIVAETTAPTWTSTNGSKVGPCSLAGFTGTIFEPINEYKGDFARAFLYLATRYMNTMSTWRNTYTYDSQYIITTSGGNYLQWYIDMLVRWHNQDPVSTKEIARNDSIYYATPQHNRNPYIDHPEYVCLVWTSTNCVSGPIITNITHNPVYPGPSNTVSVTADITDDGNITSAILQWCTDGISFGNSITMALNGAPSYITSTLIPAQTAGTTVTYRILATDNEANSTTSATCNYTVLQTEPTNHPTGFNCGTTTSSSISLSWTDATGTVIPAGYLIKASTASLASIADPVDGTPETDGSFAKNITAGTQSVSFSGLAPSTTYYFKIYPYTNSSVNINYKTSPVAVTATCTTSTGGSGSGCATDLIISEYVEGSGNNKYIEIYNGTGAVVNLSDYRLRLFPNGATTPTTDKLLSGTLADQAVNVYSNSAATIFTTDTIITTATFFNGNDALGLYKISTASYVDIFGRIGQDPGTAWTSGSLTSLNSTLVRNSSVTSGVTVNPASGFPTLATEWTQGGIDVATFLGGHIMECGTSCASPTIPSGNLSFSAITETGMTLSWVSGDGAARMVVVKQGSAVTGGPVAGTTYVANSAFGAGNTLNSGEYIVYNGAGNNVTITNLTAGQRYYVTVFDYNCTTGSELYLTPGISANQVTYSLITAATPESQYCITSTVGFVTSIDFTSTGTFTSNSYTAQLSDASGSFNTPIAIGTFSSNANSGTINCIIPANTASGTAYRIRVISSNPALTGTLSNAFEIALYSPCILPTAAFSNRNNFCMDDAGTISLSVSDGSGTTLVWTAGSCSGALVGTGNPLILDSPPDTITYFAHWENSCSLTSCTSITITPVPNVTSAFNQLGPYCVGVTPETLPVNSLNGVTGTWSPPTINSATSGTSQYIFTPNEGLCSSMDTMNIVVNAVPTGVSASASDNSICLGESVDLASASNSNADQVVIDFAENFSSANWSGGSAPYTLTNPTYGAWATLRGNTGNYWGYNAVTYISSDRSLCFVAHATRVANAWEITPGLPLAGGTTYTFTFWYRGTSGKTNQLKLTVGTVQSIAQQTTTIWSTNNITDAVWTEVTTTYTPAATGTYYFALNVFSAANQGSLYVDVFMIEHTISNPCSYSWTSIPAGFTSALQNQSAVFPLASTEYIVTATNMYGCSTSGSTTVAVSSVTPAFTQQGPYCTGDTPGVLPLTSINGITGTWSPDIISTSFAGVTTYTFTPTSGLCSSIATMDVTVNQMPVAEAGIDATYTGSPILIGSPANGPGSISWSPATGLDDPNISQPAASPATTTTYTLTINNNNCLATDAVTVTCGGAGHSINGKTVYAGRAFVGSPAPNLPTYNSANYNIDNVILILKNYPAGTEVARDTSDALGHYQFSNIMDGNYMMSYDKYAADTMQWGNDVNAADVALLMYFIASDTLFDPSRCFSAKYKKAADVDNNSFINAVDVARLKAKIGAPYLVSKNFPKGNWDALNTIVTVAGSDLNINLETICNGDYNASSSKYRDSLTTWTGAKTLPDDIIVTSDEVISITDPIYFEIPLRISSKMNDFSALGLELSYPGGYKLVNAFIPKAINKNHALKINPVLEEVITGNSDLLVTDEDGVVRIVYATTNHFDVAANDEVIVLGFRALNKLKHGDLEFKLSGTGVVANKFGEENDETHLLMPKIFVTGSGDEAGFEFAGYPNPFNDETTITYNLPENGMVKLKVYNALGEMVSELVEETQESGKHTIELSSKNLPAGVYSFKLEFSSLSQSKCLVLRLVH